MVSVHLDHHMDVYLKDDCYDSYRYKVFCYCEYGYSGDKCEYEIQGCDWQCQHDGTCIDYRCECGFLSGAYGDFCEHVHECDPDCQHGATCSRYSNTCYCTSEYYGDRCEYKYEYGDDSSPDSGLITILIPLVVIFVVFTGCIVCLKRSRCGQQAAANNTSTIIVTAAQVTYLNNETNLPPFTDSPPSYADAVPAASDSPDGAFLEGHDPCDDQLTPPPTYETVVSPLANAVYRGNSNTDLQRDQTEQSAPSGDGNQTV
ncbi:delta-like protein C [Ptychodera flava]|uniref:delta-like protein C n=1 Tax=Ptychodera flava TaxID=63121 RepID=UPI003969DFD0